MLDFIRKHWKVLALSALALAAVVGVVFFPPALVAGGIIALASSPVLAVFGSAAAAVATGVVAATAAAAVFAAGALVNGIVKAGGWLFNKVCGKSAPDESESEDDYDGTLSSTAVAAKGLGVGARRERLDAVADEDEIHVQHVSPLYAPKLCPVVARRDQQEELDASPLALAAR